MSAVADGPDGPTPVIQVLFTLYPGFDTLDFCGPLEVLNWARHDIKNPSKCDFKVKTENSNNTRHQGIQV
jgi:hypothetical protein